MFKEFEVQEAMPTTQQLEMDRRIILQRITLLKQRLLEIDKQKTTQRKNRGRMVRVALVGYTNAGPSHTTGVFHTVPCSTVRLCGISSHF